MSNSSDSNSEKNASVTANLIVNSTASTAANQIAHHVAKSKRWSFIQSDLTSALDAWQELEKAEISPSPEEEQLVKIKIIISQLKEKLEQF